MYEDPSQNEMWENEREDSILGQASDDEDTSYDEETEEEDE